MKFKKLCKLQRNILIKDLYSGYILTVEDAIFVIRDTWTDYSGDLYPIINVNKWGIPDLDVDMTQEFADLFAKDYKVVRN